MIVVAMVSRKGGVGKTTLAGHLAVEAERAGHGPVAVVDTDPQGSLTDWWNARSAPTPKFVQTTLTGLEQDLDLLRDHGTNMVIIDSPSALTRAINDVVKVADLVVIPTRQVHTTCGPCRLRSKWWNISVSRCCSPSMPRCHEHDSLRKPFH